MNRRRLLLLGVGVVMIFITAAVVLVSNVNPSNPEPTPSPKPSETSTPSPTPIPREALEPDHDHDDGTVELSERFPAVRALPQSGPYWSLALDGPIRDNKVSIKATVYVGPGQEASEAIAKQRPYVESWLRGIGQASGTYVLRFVAEEREVY